MEDPHHAAHMDLGRPGASARAEFERRRRRDAEWRRRTFGRLLAPLVAALAGERPSTARWGIGGAAEEWVGDLLTRAVGSSGLVLHDRTVPGGRANVDHIVVVATGAWVVDTKRYRGRVRRARPPGRAWSRRTLVVDGRDRGHLVASALRLRALVQAAAGPDVCVRGVLCFATPGRGGVARPFTLEGILVTGPKPLLRALAAPGPLGARERDTLARRLARAFPARPSLLAQPPASGRSLEA